MAKKELSKQHEALGFWQKDLDLLIATPENYNAHLDRLKKGDYGLDNSGKIQMFDFCVKYAGEKGILWDADKKTFYKNEKESDPFDGKPILDSPPVTTEEPKDVVRVTTLLSGTPAGFLLAVIGELEKLGYLVRDKEERQREHCVSVNITGEQTDVDLEDVLVKAIDSQGIKMVIETLQQLL